MASFGLSPRAEIMIRRCLILALILQQIYLHNIPNNLVRIRPDHAIEGAYLSKFDIYGIPTYETPKSHCVFVLTNDTAKILELVRRNYKTMTRFSRLHTVFASNDRFKSAEMLEVQELLKFPSSVQHMDETVTHDFVFKKVITGFQTLNEYGDCDYIYKLDDDITVNDAFFASEVLPFLDYFLSIDKRAVAGGFWQYQLDGVYHNVPTGSFYAIDTTLISKLEPSEKKFDEQIIAKQLGLRIDNTDIAYLDHLNYYYGFGVTYAFQWMCKWFVLHREEDLRFKEGVTCTKASTNNFHIYQFIDWARSNSLSPAGPHYPSEYKQ